MNKYKIVLVFISLFSLYSCEDFFEFSVDMDVPPHQTKLAPTTLLTNNEGNRTLFLSRSIGALENHGNELLYVENASVRINETPLNYILDNYQKGFYKLPADFQFIPNTTYNLKIEKSGFETVFAQQVMPVQVPIQEVVIGDEIIQVTFQDIPNVENYYIVELLYKDSYNDYYYPVYLEPFTDEANSSVLTRGLVFRDTFFDGQHHTFKAKYSNHSQSGNYKVRLYHITKELFLYGKSLDLNNDVSGNPFAEPNSMYTNITNGYGIFGLANMHEFSN
jgi:hypothetical protein